MRVNHKNSVIIGFISLFLWIWYVAEERRHSKFNSKNILRVKRILFVKALVFKSCYCRDERGGVMFFWFGRADLWLLICDRAYRHHSANAAIKRHQTETWARSLLYCMMADMPEHKRLTAEKGRMLVTRSYVNTSLSQIIT